MATRMELEEWFGVMVQFTKGNSKMEITQVMGDILTRMETTILDSGSMTRKMAKERCSERMEP